MPVKILMVCLGNICRSPLAEGILQSKVDPKKVIVESAGTGSWHIGNRPDERSIAVGLKHGIDIRYQRCRQFTKVDFDRFDFIYTMDKSNYSRVLTLADTKEKEMKVKLILDEIAIDVNEVPDPYYGGENGFEEVYQMLDLACDAIAKNLKTGNNA
ncbi:low molecular weight protein-tyrosine-phosphatase [Maribacter algicola]|uniref:Low molecular weight protein-tyrosine-phosphatase n=1 Tax=Meishania litoralis TaxID=3434685 RepID=A0ACC7LQC2_9FLAO